MPDVIIRRVEQGDLPALLAIRRRVSALPTDPVVSDKRQQLDGIIQACLGLEVETLPNDWRTAAESAKLETRLREDREHAIKAVLVVHNETSTGVVNDIAALRRADSSPSRRR